MGGCAPQLFCALQDVAAFEFLVGSREKIEGDLAVPSGDIVVVAICQNLPASILQGVLRVSAGRFETCPYDFGVWTPFVPRIGVRGRPRTFPP